MDFQKELTYFRFIFIYIYYLFHFFRLIPCFFRMIKYNKQLFQHVQPLKYLGILNLEQHADMRIVASTASMLEEPYLRIEEPNTLIAEKSEASKQQKGS